MPLREIAGTDFRYFLIAFDENGVEREEADGSRMSETIRRRIREDDVTDVFFTSHGWKGDIPAAIEQYDAWVAAMAGLGVDRLLVSAQRPSFKPLVVGLHWPSLPWGDEAVEEAPGGGVLGTADELDAQVETYARRIADTPRARSAIRRILAAARTDSGRMSRQTLDDYETLFAESGLGSGGVDRPGSDQDGFDPAAIRTEYEATQEASPESTQVLGWKEKVKDAVLSPLRQLSFWKMKDRARLFGETGGHALLVALQTAAPAARFHLMGHSFGCIVVSATVAGGANSAPLPRPVDSLFLVQGALSLWSYASDIPYAKGTPGYFHRIVKSRLVRGPIVTTRSKFDKAVGRFYPMGAKLKQQLTLAPEKVKFPEYGGVGAFGLQGVADVVDGVMRDARFAYEFRNGTIHNLESSGVIRNGEGASGAHSDIAHPEVAHVFWAAVIASGGGGAGGAGGGGGYLGARGDGQQQHQKQQGGPPDRVLGGGHGQRARPPVGGAPPAFPEAPSESPMADLAPSPSVDESMEGEPESAMVEAMPTLAEEAEPSDESTMAGAAPAASRFINAALEDHPKETPLEAGEWYVLAFDIDTTTRAQAVATAAFRDEAVFERGEEIVELTVQLASNDFEIQEPTRRLRVPRVGKSQGKARFDVSPRHGGRSVLTATFHKQGNFVQQVDIAFDVGAAMGAVPESASRGRSPSAATLLHPRDVGLSIQPGIGGYECMMWGPVAARAKLPVQAAQLAAAIDAARDELVAIVKRTNAAGRQPFLEGIDIDGEDDRREVLRVMSRAGARLFQQLFFGPAAGPDSKLIGERLRTMARDRATRLKLQVLAETVPVPWGLLYVGDLANPDWDDFLGMRHVIEVIPLQNDLNVLDSAIRSDNPSLAVSLNLNEGIDAQMRANYVAQQKTYWAETARVRKRLRVTPRTQSAQLKKALADTGTDDQILYFYCHAASTGLTDPGGPDASSLVLTDAAITLGDLNLDSPTSVQLAGHPLVFINACESGKMSPAFYDGFVPYFMAKGARGVVGTECETPALFAVVWAQRFFERFLDGEPLGDAFLGLRQEFLQKHGNPLGLMYAVHCDGDTQVEPALRT